MKGTILVAEDDRNLRRVLQATLSREGYEVCRRFRSYRSTDFVLI